MAIVGLTVSETGESMQRLAISTKVAIGEVVKTQNGATRPSKLDHFIFLRKSTKLEWEPDPELIAHFGKECREFWLILLDDQIENVFRTEYAWWSKTEKKCWGDGRNATRRTEKHPEGEDWTPCGDTCPDLDAGTCKPSGDLYFVLADFPRLGAVCRLHTTSYRSIRQIYSAIEQIRTVTGGRLAGIRCKLVVRPEKAAYVDPKDKQKKSTTIYALNIELGAADMKQLVDKMTEHARLFDQTRKLLGNGKQVEYVVDEEPEVERAPDIAQEFFPADEIVAAPAPAVQQPSRASAAEPTPPKSGNGNGHVEYVTNDQRRALLSVCAEAGWSNDQVKSLLKEKWGIETTAKIPVDRFDEIRNRFASGSMDERYQATDDDIPV